MCSCYEHIGSNIFCAAVHTRNTSAASALSAVCIYFLTLDITEIRHGDHAVLIRNEVFNIHFTADGFDLSASFIGKFGADRIQFCLDDAEQTFAVAEDVFVICNLQKQTVQLFFDLFSFQT